MERSSAVKRERTVMPVTIIKRERDVEFYVEKKNHGCSAYRTDAFIREWQSPSRNEGQ